jgi:hypothetical protein
MVGEEKRFEAFTTVAEHVISEEAGGSIFFSACGFL